MVCARSFFQRSIARNTSPPYVDIAALIIAGVHDVPYCFACSRIISAVDGSLGLDRAQVAMAAVYAWSPTGIFRSCNRSKIRVARETSPMRLAPTSTARIVFISGTIFLEVISVNAVCIPFISAAFANAVITESKYWSNTIHEMGQRKHYVRRG